MTVPKRITLEPLREERKRDLGFPILCFLFLVGKFLDVYTLIDVYYRWDIGREVFNPINNFFIRRALGLPGDWLGDYELNPLHSFAIYRFGIPGLLASQMLNTAIVLLGVVVLWKLSYHPGNTKQRVSRFLIKAFLYSFTIVSVLFAIVNSLAIPAP